MTMTAATEIAPAMTDTALPVYLNVGCGHYPAPSPWVNLERNPEVAAKVGAAVADVCSLPYPDMSVSRIYLGHILEHLEQEVVPAALAECMRVLVWGGEVCAVGPDVLRGYEMHTMGLISAEQLATLQRGAQGYDGDAHRWDCHQERLLELFHMVFHGPHAQAVTLNEVQRNGYPLVSMAQWQCAVVGWKVQPRERR